MTLVDPNDTTAGEIAAAERRRQLVERNGVPALTLPDEPSGIDALDTAAARWEQVRDEHRQVTADLREAQSRPAQLAAERADIEAAAAAALDGAADPGSPAGDALRERVAVLARRRRVLGAAAVIGERDLIAAWNDARPQLEADARERLADARRQVDDALHALATALGSVHLAERAAAFAHQGPTVRLSPAPLTLPGPGPDGHPVPAESVLDVVRDRAHRPTPMEDTGAAFLDESATKRRRGRPGRAVTGEAIAYAADTTDDDD